MGILWSLGKSLGIETILGTCNSSGLGIIGNSLGIETILGTGNSSGLGMIGNSSGLGMILGRGISRVFELFPGSLPRVLDWTCA